VALLSIGDGVFALRKMFVHEDFRGARGGIPGVAQRLLEHALKWASENRGIRVYLGTTEKFVAAQKFYRKNGFEEIECAMLPHSFPVMKVDSRFFFKDLRGAL
jgi:GNAT superfamily N-acetyltransferase